MKRYLSIIIASFCLVACENPTPGGAGSAGGNGGGGSGGMGGGGGAGPTRPTCEVLGDPTNCWNAAVAELYACVPDEMGTLSADRSSCTYPDGTTIEFKSPLPTSDANFLPDFTVRKADSSICGKFSEIAGTRNAIVGSTDATFYQEPGPKLTLQCNGEVVMTDSFSNVLDCAGMGIPLPSWGAMLDDTSASITIGAVGQMGPLFQCTM